MSDKQEIKPEEQTDKLDLNLAVIDAMKSVYDPEIPVNIYDLGLIYGVKVDNEGNVEIEMTLTSPACPVAGSLPPEVEMRVKGIPGVKSCTVKLVWDPPWGMEMMSEEARLQLNLY
jgi:FeS assembly SUF system protein